MSGRVFPPPAAMSPAEAAGWTRRQAFIANLRAVIGRAYPRVHLLWDHRPSNGDIRIIGSMDDGDLRAFTPLTNSRLVSLLSH